MKTIVEIETNLSKYLLDDAEAITVNADTIAVGEPTRFTVTDLDSGTAVVYGDVTAPDDWIGNKYTFNGTDWALNPDWVDPTLLA